MKTEPAATNNSPPTIGRMLNNVFGSVFGTTSSHKSSSTTSSSIYKPQYASNPSSAVKPTNTDYNSYSTSTTSNRRTAAYNGESPQNRASLATAPSPLSSQVVDLTEEDAKNGTLDDDQEDDDDDDEDDYLADSRRNTKALSASALLALIDSTNNTSPSKQQQTTSTKKFSVLEPTF